MKASKQEEHFSPIESGPKIYLRLLSYLKFVGSPFAISILGFAIFAATQPSLAKLLGLIIEAIEGKGAHMTFQLPTANVSLSLNPQYWLPLAAIIIFII